MGFLLHVKPMISGAMLRNRGCKTVVQRSNTRGNGESSHKKRRGLSRVFVCNRLRELQRTMVVMLALLLLVSDSGVVVVAAPLTCGLRLAGIGKALTRILKSARAPAAIG